MKKAHKIALALFGLAVTGTVTACTDDSDPGVSGLDGGGSGGAKTDGGGAGGASTAGAGGSSAGAGGETDDGGGGSTEDGGDGAAGDAAGQKITSSTGMWVIYPDPYGDGGVANPIMATIMGSAEAFGLPGPKMRLTLSVTGLPPSRAFGSHLHKLACDDNKAGGHYQNMPFPDGGSANDPAFANAQNEAWLDFTTNANGDGMSQTIVSWVPRAGEAKAIVIHDMKTGDGGVAGAKLACINIPF